MANYTFGTSCKINSSWSPFSIPILRIDSDERGFYIEHISVPFVRLRSLNELLVPNSLPLFLLSPFLKIGSGPCKLSILRLELNTFRSR